MFISDWFKFCIELSYFFNIWSKFLEFVRYAAVIFCEPDTKNRTEGWEKDDVFKK